MSNSRSSNTLKEPIEKALGALQSLWPKLGWLGLLALLALLVAVVQLMSGGAGVIEVKPGQVAVIYNNIGLGIFGEPTKAVTEQGILTYIPGAQSVQILDGRSQTLVMGEGGNEEEDAAVRKSLYTRTQRNVTRALTVRAKDGSDFFFRRMELQYQVVPAQAAAVISHAGPGRAYTEVIIPFAREILRDEFGRYSFLEVANPAVYNRATGEARRRLNEALQPFGLEVTQIITPKPSFRKDVEERILARQSAEQEIEVQQEKRNKLQQEKGRRIQDISQEKNAEYQSLSAELAAKKKAAENNLIRVKREADKYFIARSAEGKAYETQMTTQAKANEVAYRKAAEAIALKINAVGAAGPEVLNQEIAEHVFPQLQKISATPWAKPSSATQIRYLNGNN